MIKKEDDQGGRHLLGSEVNGTDLELEVTSHDMTGRIVHLLVSSIESLLAGWFPTAKYERFIRVGEGESSVDELLATLMNIKSQRAFFRLSGCKDWKRTKKGRGGKNSQKRNIVSNHSQV